MTAHEPVWKGRRVLICVGTGGVGKTTVSAALALAAATAGLRVLVMTIDPARRLAHALGLDNIGNDERRIEPEQLAPFDLHLGGGALWAMMPDVKRTFDELVGRWAPTPERAKQILDNTIYQHFSSALAGSHEYAAVEKLYEVYNSGKYDLIVLDTPPSQNAVEFLDAPGRIIDFLDTDSLQWLKRPTAIAGKLSARLFDMGSNFLFRSVGKLAGADTLHQLTEFLLSFQGMYEGFRQRSREVRELLRSDDLGFVVVSATGQAQRRSMHRFYNELTGQRLPVRGIVLNRVRQLPCPPEAEARLQTRVDALLSSLSTSSASLIREALRDELALAKRDAAAAQELRAQRPNIPLIILPELRLDAHDLESLARLHRGFL